MLQNFIHHLPDSNSYSNIHFIGYIDPGLGYSFQGLGPILPAIAGAITGSIALFWKQIKLFINKIIGKKN